MVERNAEDANALQALGIIHEFNQRFIQATNAYQRYEKCSGSSTSRRRFSFQLVQPDEPTGRSGENGSKRLRTRLLVGAKSARRADSSLASSRTGHAQLDAFVVQGVKITLLDVLWICIAHGKMNKRVEGIESMLGSPCDFLKSHVRFCSSETSDRRPSNQRQGPLDSVDFSGSLPLSHRCTSRNTTRF